MEIKWKGSSPKHRKQVCSTQESVKDEDDGDDDKMATLLLETSPHLTPTASTSQAHLPPLYLALAALCRHPVTCLHRSSIWSAIWRWPPKLSDFRLPNKSRVISR